MMLLLPLSSTTNCNAKDVSDAVDFLFLSVVWRSQRSSCLSRHPPFSVWPNHPDPYLLHPLLSPARISFARCSLLPQIPQILRPRNHSRSGSSIELSSCSYLSPLLAASLQRRVRVRSFSERHSGRQQWQWNQEESELNTLPSSPGELFSIAWLCRFSLILSMHSHSSSSLTHSSHVVPF